jgi:Fur family zinc uptake transcriptional regulator
MSTPSNVLIPFARSGHNHGHCIHAALKTAEQRCQEQGLRLTPIRRRVLELVWENHEPAKAYDILEHLQQENPRAAPPTVYRALDFLLEAGLIHRLESLNAYFGCGNPALPHVGQFLICRACGAVAEINDPEITALLSRQAAQLDFTVDRQTVEIKGLCPQCRSNT